jgi:NADH-quinone oxidoreductase subunit G
LAGRALDKAFVISLTSYVTEAHKTYADVLLPLATFAETAGTFVNCEGRWQSFTGMAAGHAEARPGWKLLRVLGNLLDQPGFEYMTVQQVTDEVRALCATATLNTKPAGYVPQQMAAIEGLQRVAELPPYAIDAIVRRATALQQTTDADCAPLTINSALAAQLGVSAGDQVVVTQGETNVTLPVTVDDGVATNCVVMPTAVAAVTALGPACGPLRLTKA